MKMFFDYSTIFSFKSSHTLEKSKLVEIKHQFLILLDETAHRVLLEIEKGVTVNFNQTTYDALGVLYIEPKYIRKKPIIDDVTKKMLWLWHHKVETGLNNFGSHVCSCGISSDSCEHLLVSPDGTFFMTNSLCVHYVVFHRSEISKSEWKKINRLIAKISLSEVLNDVD